MLISIMREELEFKALHKITHLLYLLPEWKKLNLFQARVEHSTTYVSHPPEVKIKYILNTLPSASICPYPSSMPPSHPLAGPCPCA